MDVGQARSSKHLLLTRAVAKESFGQLHRPRLSLPWLSTLIFTSLISVFALGWVFVGRDDVRIQSPTYVTVWRPPAVPGSPVTSVPVAERLMVSDDLLLRTAAIAAPTGPILPTVDASETFGADLAVKSYGDHAIVARSPFVHLKLSLLPSETSVAPVQQPVVAAAATTGRGGPPAATAMRPFYRADLDSRLTLTAIDFPFAKASLRLGVDPQPRRTEPEPVVAASSVLQSLEAEAAGAVDLARFGDPLPVDALSFAPPHRSRNLPQFAGLALGAENPSWRRLADNRSGGALETVATAGFEADSGRTRFRDQTRTFFTRVLEEGAIDGSETRIIDGMVQDVSADAPGAPGSPTVETEEAFFPSSRTPTTTIYDALRRAAEANGLAPAVTAQLVKLLSAEYDFDESVGPNDRLDVFFSNADGDAGRKPGEAAVETSRLYLIRATFGSTYRAFYRFESEDGTVEYFGPEGRSARQLLLRNPVPNGRFQSGFGIRRHPILGYDRMHNGIDWSAPKGTPIFATASGTVERAGVNGGFGLQTVIRHDNGYETSYAHQSAVADGIVEGAAVRQGEVIGFVGSTGLATGAHIHYEVMHDGVEIDPMQIAASDGPMLRGTRLDAFLAERDRIDALVYSGDDAVLSLAAVRN